MNNPAIQPAQGRAPAVAAATPALDWRLRRFSDFPADPNSELGKATKDR